VVKWKEVMHLVTQGDGPIRGVTLDAMKSLTILYALTGRYTEAESQWKELFRNEETFHWHDSDWTFVGRLAEVYMSRGRYENAEAVLIDAKKYVVKDSDVKRVDLLLELLKFQLAKLGKVQGTSGDREASPEVAV
jgi:tetratricopeptide (TPR) repeat protein